MKPWALCPALRDIVGQGLRSSPPPADDPRRLASWIASRSALDHLASGTVRPILVPNWVPDQIPEWSSIRDTYDYAVAANLPFHRLALDFGPGMVVRGGGGTARMAAAIIDRVGGALRITPLARTSIGNVHGLITTLWGPDSDGVAGTVAVGPESSLTQYVHATSNPDVDSMSLLQNWAVTMAAACLATLYLTEALNVTLETLNVTRQIRRNHDGPLWIPQLITIESRESARQIRTSPVHSRLTMQHQVRGHYKHHGPGTPIYENNPRDVVLDPGRGEVVRVWCPPYLAGPEHAPLRPQVWTLPGYVETAERF